MHKLYTAYTLALVALAAIGGVASAWVIYRLDPAAGLANVLAFYASTGGFILGLSALFLYLLRARFGTREKIKRHFYVSLRQGAWISVLYMASMYLESVQLFSWMSSGLLVVALTFLETYFLHNERKNPYENDGQSAANQV